MAMYSVPDNYIISNTEWSGYADGMAPEERAPSCPVCRSECETVYKGKNFEIVGCDVCLKPVDAVECSDCFQ